MNEVKPMSAQDALFAIERLGELISALNNIGRVYGLETIKLEGGFADQLRAIAIGKHEVHLFETEEVRNLSDQLQVAQERIDELMNALEKSVKLQGFYATLLNLYDGGKRIEFVDAAEWMQRLKSGI